jgi:hypothetical protein
MESRPRRLFTTALAAGLLAAVTTLAGCGGSNGGTTSPGADESLTATPAAQATAAPPADAKVIGVTVTGDSVSPSGTRVTVKPNQPVVFEIDATTEGELHVHSTPAKAIEYPAGKSRVQIAIDKPGVVEVEIEQLGKQVVQLEVK